ncbi:hypothetical protein TNCV_2744541 [Trichonephila clavipes]|nr:hypothetical protein TNCV_2744541 [Trichonephila clavipes]
MPKELYLYYPWLKKNTINEDACSMPKLWSWRWVVASSIVKIYRPFENFSELNHTVTYMLLKAKANDRRTSSPLSG